MAFVHGMTERVLFNGFELSAYLKTTKVMHQGQAVDVTSLNSAAKSYIAGLREGQISLSGMYDPTAILGSDVVLQTALNTNDAIATLLPNSDTVGNRAHGFDLTEVKYDITSPVNGVNSIAIDGTSNVGVESLIVHHAISAETVTVNGASQDNGGATTNGGVGYIHVPAYSGITNLVVTIQDSADNVTFATILTFAAVTAINASQRVAISGNVRRYTRTVITITGVGSVTPFVAFGRK